MKTERMLTASQAGAEGLPDLEKKCESTLREWAADSPTFLFALHELLINALDVNRKGGQPTSFLKVKLFLNPGCLMAEVSDDGPGMPAGWRESMDSIRMEDLLNEESGRGLLFIRELGFAVESARDESGRHIMRLKARINRHG